MGKSQLRTCGSKNSLCPDVYWESCSPCVAVASERRWTLRLPPSPRFQRAGLAGGRGSSPSAETQPDGAGLVDRRGLAGLASRRCLLGRRGACRRFPAHPRTLERTPRAEHSDRKTTAPPSPQRKPPIQARGSGYRFKIPQVCTAQQNTNQNQGHRLPKSGGHHNRRPTGGVRLSTKLIRCNDYQTRRPLRMHPGKPAPTGVLRGTP